VYRELKEEMGLDTTMTRCFTFRYKDEKVNTWGDCWHAIHDGPIDEMELQEEEVSEVLLMAPAELLAASERGENVTKDSLHCLKLYQQFVKDKEDGTEVNDVAYDLRS
jgi:hypothetical protein